MSLPVGEFPPFELTPSAVLTARSVYVGSDDDHDDHYERKTLAPGTYGNVRLEHCSELTLTAGTYNFKSLRMTGKSKVYFTGPAKIHIRYGIYAQDGSYFGTRPDLSISPGDIVVHVQGMNSEGPQGNNYGGGFSAVDFGSCSRVLGTLYAPNGTISLKQGTQAAGSFFGRDVVIGASTTVRLASGFGIIAKSAAAEELAGPANAQEVPTMYVLSQNYPNPFNPTTQIKYGLPQAGPVNLTIYNMLGQEVVQLVDQVQPEGYHVAEWNGRNQFGTVVGSGMYIFQLRAGDFVQTKKMMLLK